jgi:RimJ/RimL family protein N-acetyltransferase
MEPTAVTSAGAAAPVNDVVERVTEAARQFLGGRRVVLVGLPVAAATRFVGLLRRLGSDQCLVVGTTLGAGELPDRADAAWVDLDIDAADLMDEFRQFERTVADPPSDLTAALDRFDPDGDALVLAAPYQAVAAIGGRPVVGARPPAWVALEDKTANDTLFDRAGVARSPCEIVAAGDADGLVAAAARVDAGQGTVWSGDARDGFNGGGSFVRWVTDEAQAADAHEFFAPRCEAVRVAPFLEGTPCSIHGFATDDGLAVFRPVEGITLRSTSPPRLQYAGTSTFWDPPSADRAAMRVVALRVGALLRSEVGFRGSYSVDGVLTGQGFRPTELNPRWGAGMDVLGQGLPGLPLLILQWAVAAGRPSPVTADELEATVVASADANRAGGGWVTGSTAWHETREHAVVATDDGCRAATRHGTAGGDAPGEATGVVTTGPSSHGGFVRFTATPDRTPVGPPLAPRVAAAFRWADEALGAGIGPLEAAVPVDRATRTPAHGITPPARMETASGAVLRRARPSDADAFARAVAENLDHLRPWMPWATPAAADAAVQRERLVGADATWDDGSDYEFAVLTADERQVIGGCGLMRRIGPGGIEIGYWVHVDRTRRGHATAAALALTEAAWTLPDVERVEIHCDEANVASRAVPARLGYRLDRIDDDSVTAPGETGRRMIWIAERTGGPG